MSAGRWPIALAGLAACAAALASPADRTWQLPFWIDGDVEGVSETDVLTHPCGATVLLSVGSIPLGRPNVDTDKVVEFDPAGRIVREWRTPVDYPPVAIDGDRLIVRGWAGEKARSLAISTAGEIGEVDGANAELEGAELQCPAAVASHFDGSDYLRCEMRTDRSNGARRLLAYEGPCT